MSGRVFVFALSLVRVVSRRGVQQYARTVVSSARSRRGAGVGHCPLPTAHCPLVLVGCGLALALVASAFADDPYEQPAREIARALQCPVCQGASVADSPSELAQQMRAIIRRKLEAGESREQIVAFFQERYGDSVLREPPRQGFSLLVWIVPVVTVLAGAWFVGRFFQVRRMARPSPALAADDEAAAGEEERLWAELERLGESRP